VVQDAFVAAFERLNQLQDTAQFRRWLTSIAVDQAHRRLRRRRFQQLLHLEPSESDNTVETIASMALSPEWTTELSKLDQALRQLSDASRIAWQLRHVEGYRLEEIAEFCRCSLVVLLCDPSPDAVTSMVYKDGTQVLERKVDLSDVQDDSRTRTLAVVLAETLAALERPLVGSTTPKAISPTSRLLAARPEHLGSVHVVAGTVRPIEALDERRGMLDWRAGAGFFARGYSRPGAPFLGIEAHAGYGRLATEILGARSHNAVASGATTHSFVAAAVVFQLARFGTQMASVIPRLRVEGALLGQRVSPIAPAP